MNQKWKKIIALFLVMTLAFVGAGNTKAAKAADYVDITDSKSLSVLGEPGQTTHVEIPITASSFWYTLNVIAEPEKGAPMTVENIKLTTVDKTTEIYNLSEGTRAVIQFDVVMKDNATIGNYEVSVGFKGQGYLYDGSEMEEIDSTQTVGVTSVTVVVLNEREPIQLTVDSVNYPANRATPGNTFSLTLKVKNEGEITAYNTYMSLGFDEGSGMIPGYSVESKKIGTLSSKASSEITLPIEVLADAATGSRPITVNFTCKDADGTSFTFSRTIYVNITGGAGGSGGAVLDIDAADNMMEVKADSDIAIELDLKNIGNLKATGITASVDGIGISTGIIKGYAESEVSIDDISEGESGKLTIPLKLTKNVTGGLTELTVNISYYSNTTLKTEKITYYLSVDAAEQEVKAENYVTISNVTQSPSAPQAGEGITVMFNINNAGDETIRNVRVSGTGLSSSGFEPINSEPYQTVGDIEAGGKKTVTMKFNVGKNIQEGLNTLSINYQYFDGNGQKQTEDASLYILNVENSQRGDSVSKPKLIISNYGVDSAELRAGSTFNFEFELTNTHASKAAKNITVTITQAEDIFSPTQGSNSFYISSIDAGESVTNSLPMKVKTSTATGAYDISVLIQYEYDEMAEADTLKGGVEETHLVKLNAIENSRPMIENIYLEDWDGVYVGTDMTMSFEFYNMGMSSLNNVYVTVEGDFELSNNSAMKYVGSLSSYMSEYVDLSVVPLTEGDAVGKIIVHFEDSTGAEITKESEFTTYVSAAESMGGDDFGGDYGGDFGGDYGGDFGMPVDSDEVEKEAIMPVWLFIIILFAVFAISMPVTYKVIISIKKKQLLKAMDSEE